MGKAKGSRAERDAAGLLDLAINKTQRRDLKKLLGTDALVERVAGAVAIHKSAKLIVRDSDAIHISDSDILELYHALTTVQQLLAKMHASTEGKFFGTAANDLSHRLNNPIIGRHRVAAPFSLSDTEIALYFLEIAVSFFVENITKSKGGRPRKTTGDLLLSFVDEIVRDSGKKSPKILPEVLRIALEAGGEEPEEFDKIFDRRRPRRGAPVKRNGKRKVQTKGKPARFVPST